MTVGRHPAFSDQEAAEYLGCSEEGLGKLLAQYPVPRTPSGPDAGKLMGNCFVFMAEAILASAGASGREGQRREGARRSQGGCGG